MKKNIIIIVLILFIAGLLFYFKVIPTIDFGNNRSSEYSLSPEKAREFCRSHKATDCPNTICKIDSLPNVEGDSGGFRGGPSLSCMLKTCLEYKSPKSAPIYCQKNK